MLPADLDTLVVKAILQAMERLVLDLAYPLSRDSKVLADLLERQGWLAIEPESHTQDPCRDGIETVQQLSHLLDVIPSFNGTLTWLG